MLSIFNKLLCKLGRPAASRLSNIAAIIAAPPWLVPFSSKPALSAVPIEAAPWPHHVSCWAANRLVFVGARAGLSERRGQAYFRKAYARWGPGPTAGLKGCSQTTPGRLIPPPKWVRQHWVRGLDTQCLNGPLARYVRCGVVIRISKPYGVPADRYIDLRKMEAAMESEPRLSQKFGLILAKCMPKGYRPQKIIHEIAAKFLRRPDQTGFVLPLLPKNMLRHQAFKWADTCAFPRWDAVDRKPKAWQRDDYHAGLEMLYVVEVLGEKREKAFVLLLASIELGSWRFIEAERVSTRACGRRAVGMLMQSVVTNGGGLSSQRLTRAVTTLRQLGSPTALWPDSGPRIMLHSLTSQPTSIFMPGRLVPCRLPHSQLGFVFIYDPNPSKFCKGKSTFPGSFLYGTAQEYVIGHAITRVLSEVRAGPGLHLPSRNWLVRSIPASTLSPDVAGTKCPTFVKKWPFNKGLFY